MCTLKKLIKKQLCDDVIAWEEFDVGYINKRGEKVVSIRTEVQRISRRCGKKSKLKVTEYSCGVMD